MYPCIKLIKCILVKAGKVVWQMVSLKIPSCVTISLKRGERDGLIGVKGKTTMYPCIKATAGKVDTWKMANLIHQHLKRGERGMKG